MGCCSRRRTQFHAEPLGGSPAGGPPQTRGPIGPASTPIYFEYTGQTGLSVRGPITGRNYRFGGPGARIGVDSRDAPALMAVPMLRTERA
jgi:hypothetical protein